MSGVPPHGALRCLQRVLRSVQYSFVNYLYNNEPITVIHNKTPQFNDPLQLHCTIIPLQRDTDGFYGVHFTKWINVHCYSLLLLDENRTSPNVFAQKLLMVSW